MVNNGDDDGDGDLDADDGNEHYDNSPHLIVHDGIDKYCDTVLGQDLWAFKISLLIYTVIIIVTTTPTSIIIIVNTFLISFST